MEFVLPGSPPMRNYQLEIVAHIHFVTQGRNHRLPPSRHRSLVYAHAETLHYLRFAIINF